MVRTQMPNCVMVNNWERVVTGTNVGDYTINSSGTDTAAQAAFVAGVMTYPFVVSGGNRRSSVLHLGGM